MFFQKGGIFQFRGKSNSLKLRNVLIDSKKISEKLKDFQTDMQRNIFNKQIENEDCIT